MNSNLTVLDILALGSIASSIVAIFFYFLLGRRKK